MCMMARLGNRAVRSIPKPDDGKLAITSLTKKSWGYFRVSTRTATSSKLSLNSDLLDISDTRAELIPKD